METSRKGLAGVVAPVVIVTLVLLAHTVGSQGFAVGSRTVVDPGRAQRDGIGGGT